MQYQISGIHINIGDALQTYVKDELKNTIDKYAQRPTDTQVIFQKMVMNMFVMQLSTYPVG